MRTEALVTAEESKSAELQASAELQVAAEQQVAETRAPDEHTADELRDAAAHGVRWSAIARPTVEILQLGSIVILARLIVPAEFGRYAIALIAQEVAYLMVAGGLSSALVQRKTIDREHQQTGMALGLLAGLALAVITLIAASVIVAPIFGERTAFFVRLMAPLCLVAALSTVPTATLRRKMAFRRLSEIEVLSTVARVVVCIGLALVGLSGEALVLGVLAGSLATGVIAWVSAPPPAPRLHRKAARELLSYGLPVSLASVSWIGFSNVDYAIIGARLGALQTGFYFRAYTLSVEYQSKISVVMSQVGFPVLARTRSAAELSQLYRQMVRTLTILLFPLLVLLTITAPVLVPFLFGARWASAVVPVQILALGGASTLVVDAVGTVFMATGRARALLGYGTAHFIVYGLTVLVVVRFGIVAVAIDAAVVHTLFLVVAYVMMLNGTEERALPRLLSDIAPAMLSCVGLVVVALPVSLGLTAIGTPAILWLAAVGLVAIPPYMLTLRLVFPESWRSQRSILERIVPASKGLNRVGRRLAAVRVRFSG
jgi:O-antigen/teichoic acid export membrane protein